jgi:hypothetical protein
VANPFRRSWLTLVAAGAMALFFMTSFSNAVDANPEGNWDAAATWNLRAKFLAAPGGWHNAVNPRLEQAAHAEYPLLWPATIARVWAESGSAGDPATPIAAGALAVIALIVLLGAGVTVFRGPALGGAAALLLLATLPVWRQAAGQYADLPLALLILGALLAAVVAWRREWPTATMMLAGLLASLAAFTKSEGLLFCLCAGLTVAWMARGRAWPWLVGAAPVLALALVFRFVMAPATPMISAAMLGETGRLGALVSGLGVNVMVMGIFPAHPLLLAALLVAALRWRRPAELPWPLLAAVPLYLAAAVVSLWGSPAEIEWQLATAVDRPVLQILPALYFAILFVLNEPQSDPEPVALPDPPPAPVRRPRLH